MVLLLIAGFLRAVRGHILVRLMCRSWLAFVEFCIIGACLSKPHINGTSGICIYVCMYVFIVMVRPSPARPHALAGSPHLFGTTFALLSFRV